MNSDVFAERLRLVLGGESVNSFARKCGVGESLLRKYLAGGMPGLDKAAAIADVAGVSLDWLATGRGVMRPRASAAHDAGTRQVDANLLRETISIVEEWLVLNNRSMEPAKKADVISKLYQFLAEDIADGSARIDRRTAQKILRLVA